MPLGGYRGAGGTGSHPLLVSFPPSLPSHIVNYLLQPLPNPLNYHKGKVKVFKTR